MKIKKTTIFLFIIILLNQGCNNNHAQYKELLSIDSSFEKAYSYNKMWVISMIDYTISELESVEKWKTNHLIFELKKSQELFIKIESKLDSINLQLRLKKVDFNNSNLYISKIVNDYISENFVLVDSFISRRINKYKDVKSDMKKTIIFYKNKKEYISEHNEIALNTLNLTKLKADLLTLNYKTNCILSSNFQMEDFPKPPGEFIIADNHDVIKAGEKYYAKIIYASNFIVSMTKHIKEIKIAEIRKDNIVDKVNIDCKLKNDIIEFEYIPKEKGNYSYTGFISYNQGNGEIAKITFENSFIIK